MTQGEKDPTAADIISQFTDNTDGLKTMLSDIRDTTSNRGLKIRISKLLKCLNEHSFKRNELDKIKTPYGNSEVIENNQYNSIPNENNTMEL